MAEAKTQEQLDAEAAAAAEKIELTQAAIDEIANKAFARGAANGSDPKALKEAQTTLATLQEKFEAQAAELEEARKKATPTAGGSGTGATGDQDQLVVELRNQIEQTNKQFGEKIEALQTATTEERAKREESENKLALEGLRNTVLRTAGELEVHDAEAVFTLMNAHGVFRKNDSGAFEVVDPTTGKLRIDVSAEAAGNPLAVDAAVKEFVDQRQFLVKSSGRTGSGQGAGMGNGSGNDVQEGQGNLPSLPEGVDPQNIKPSQMAQHGAAIREFVAAGGKISVSGSATNVSA